MPVDDPVCRPKTPFAATVAAVRSGEQDIDRAVAALLNRLTTEETLWLLDGDTPVVGGSLQMLQRYNATPFPAGRIDRLGIPGIRFADGPRGVTSGTCTSFPVALARAATWDPELEERIGAAIGAEARAQGANLFAGVCVNLAYSPGWGRSQESYGEDPVLLGTMGAALARGASPWVLTCVKHFALNSMEEARFRVDVRVAPDVLHEVYLPHFRTVVEAGADAVMSAYNRVNGEWCGQSRTLLTDVLRGDLGFDGFVLTDFIFGLRDPVGSVSAGQDLEMPFRQQRAAALPAALADGRLDPADVRRSAARLIAAQVRLALRARTEPPADVVACPQHQALAREAARRGPVLLRNETVDGLKVLPIDANSARRVAVLGPLADQPNQGDVGSSRVHPPYAVSLLDALRERLGDRVTHVGGSDPARAAVAARDADVAIVAVGLSSADEGESMVGVDAETARLVGGRLRHRPLAAMLSRALRLVTRLKGFGGDRRDLHLPAPHVALIDAVAAVNPRTVVVVIGGGTVMLEPWDERVGAVLLGWYPGMEGGRALADILLGDAEPEGRLPFAIPRRRADLPQVDWDASVVTYGRWWGQRALDRAGRVAAYPLGFGLGWTAFALADLRVSAVDGERFTADVTVANTGARPGRHVVQMYVVLPADTGRPVRHLVGFRSVRVDAGATARVTVACSTRPLQRWRNGAFRLDGGAVRIEAASYSGDPAAASATLVLTEWPAAGG